MRIECRIVFALFLCSFNETFSNIHWFFHGHPCGEVIAELRSRGSTFLMFEIFLFIPGSVCKIIFLLADLISNLLLSILIIFYYAINTEISTLRHWSTYTLISINIIYYIHYQIYFISCFIAFDSSLKINGVLNHWLRERNNSNLKFAYYYL